MLIIEVDGFSHEDEYQQFKDLKRDNDLKEIGFTTLRFSSWEVLNRIDDVQVIIAEWIEENAICPPPAPPPAGEIGFCQNQISKLKIKFKNLNETVKLILALAVTDRMYSFPRWRGTKGVEQKQIPYLVKPQ